MKSILISCLALMLFVCCESSKPQNRNPNLPEYQVNFTLNLNLPAYNKLTFQSNGIYYREAGVRGVFVFNTGSGFTAFDAACPNQPLSDCSTMTLNGINAVCACDKKEYSLFTGLGNMPYPLKAYRVETSGNNVRVFN